MILDELFTSKGLRKDGRRADELQHRIIKVGKNFEDNADGSAYIQHGRTKVWVDVHGPVEMPAKEAFDSGVGADGVIKVAMVALCPSSLVAENDEYGDDKHLLMIRECLEAVTVMDVYSGFIINVQIHILEEDGNCLGTVVSAASLALADAGITMRDLIAAVTLRHVTTDYENPKGKGDIFLVDCTAAEEAAMKRNNGTVLFYGRCNAIKGVCMLHCEGGIFERAWAQMMKLANQSAVAIANEMNRCMELDYIKAPARPDPETGEYPLRLSALKHAGFRIEYFIPVLFALLFLVLTLMGVKKFRSCWKPEHALRETLMQI
eukprot:gnl/MRDRNA2_/MRDRNA2_149180_c0_seq1.p1 gnl/MRDRNA2_/MRDRNA2_149180_c0~~gnl/MRDRNA2_/MRDRNA2_149180_c0_seq1.p1  ORF type:complete len:320 (-),score=56.55 gnl/MRDRNA2_/MRDRNA2_149180_c0_seq1:57-1016(-)